MFEYMDHADQVETTGHCVETTGVETDGTGYLKHGRTVAGVELGPAQSAGGKSGGERAQKAAIAAADIENVGRHVDEKGLQRLDNAG